jgi:hypothetical protein
MADYDLDNQSPVPGWSREFLVFVNVHWGPPGMKCLCFMSNIHIDAVLKQFHL